MKIDRTVMPYVSKEELKELLDSLTGIEKNSLLEVLKTDDDTINALDASRKKFCDKTTQRVEKIDTLMSDLEDELKELGNDLDNYEQE